MTNKLPKAINCMHAFSLESRLCFLRTSKWLILLTRQCCFFLLVNCSFNYVNSLTAPVECSSYTTLNTVDRASKPSNNIFKCDRNDLSSVPAWYRFSGAAGTKMPTSSVPINHCGTHAPGWMNGQHPSKNDGPVSRKVCFHWSNNVCRWSIQITVRSCGSFFVYKLPRTNYCSLRYCGDNGYSKLNCLSLNFLNVIPGL